MKAFVTALDWEPCASHIEYQPNNGWSVGIIMKGLGRLINKKYFFEFLAFFVIYFDIFVAYLTYNVIFKSTFAGNFDTS